MPFVSHIAGKGNPPADAYVASLSWPAQPGNTKHKTKPHRKHRTEEYHTDITNRKYTNILPKAPDNTGICHVTTLGY